MSSQRTPSYRTLNVNGKASCKQAEESLREQAEAVTLSLRAAAEPIVQLPAAINKLKEEGREDDVKNLLTLSRGIARDHDQLCLERKELDDELTRIMSDKPKRGKDISRFVANCTLTGLQYIGLNERILATVTKSATDFDELLEGNAARAAVTTQPNHV